MNNHLEQNINKQEIRKGDKNGLQNYFKRR